MTADELQRIATRLGNSCWCRHWLNYNHPNNPRMMAIQCMDWGETGRMECHGHGDFEPEVKLRPVPVRDLLKLGFKEEETHLYVIDRTNPDGTPFIGTL